LRAKDELRTFECYCPKLFASNPIWEEAQLHVMRERVSFEAERPGIVRSGLRPRTITKPSHTSSMIPVRVPGRRRIGGERHGRKRIGGRLKPSIAGKSQASISSLEWLVRSHTGDPADPEHLMPSMSASKAVCSRPHWLESAAQARAPQCARNCFRHQAAASRAGPSIHSESES
jgi:hypothetical protein